MKARKATAGEIEVFEFLNDIRDEGETNMLDNLAHDIESEFGYVREECQRLHRLWVKNVFSNPDVDYAKIED
jgi:hypothetical protein